MRGAYKVPTMPHKPSPYACTLLRMLRAARAYRTRTGLPVHTWGARVLARCPQGTTAWAAAYTVASYRM